MRKTTFVSGMAVAGMLLGAGVSRAAARSTGDSIRAVQDLSRGTKPSMYLRSNEVVYSLGESITVTLDSDDNGHLSGKTQFLYRQDLQTGEIRYINTVAGLLPAGQITDIGGNSGDFDLLPIANVQNQVLLGAGGTIGAALAADTAGNFQIVLELRDATGQRIFARANWKYAVVEAVMTLPAEITTDTTLTSNFAWLADGKATFVREGATLTIEPGTYVLGANVGTLVIERGARILAEGTAARPIVMTSAQSVGSRNRADWGGLVINGRAPINIPGGVGIGEGGTGAFGGTDPEDDSGVLRYVRVEFAGFEFSLDNELNGIAFQGVGRSTTVEFVQVHFNKDDGMEFFGGTCDMKYVLLTGIADDSLDWTDGWQGRAQFVVAQQRGDDADQGIEADNNGDNNELTPRSMPTIYNATFIGAPTTAEGDESDIGVLLREGTAARLYNFIVTGFKEVGVEIDNLSTFTQAQSGNLTFDHSIIFGNGADPALSGRGNFSLDEGEGAPLTTQTFMTVNMTRNRVVDPELRDPFNTTSPDFRPALESPARDVNFVKIPPDDGFFDTTVTFVGGVDPLHDWTATGWTTTAPN